MFSILSKIKFYFLSSLKIIFKYYFTWKIKKVVKSYGDNLKVNFKIVATRNTVLGNNVNFNGMKIIGSGRVVIGDNFHSGEQCLMISHDHNYDNGTKIPYDNTYISKDIFIEDQVWLGSRVIVLGGVTIGEGAIIQAGSVVVKNIPKYAIAGGHPCRVFKYRDIAHYESLKFKKLFH